MEKYEIQKLRELPIEGVAERLGLDVKKHRCLCCFHDDHTPSMSFSIPRNTFHCWACGAKGGTLDLAMQVLGKPFVEAARWLADENNIILSEYKPAAAVEPKPFDAVRYGRYFEHPWLTDAARNFLFEERHLHPAVVEFCRLTSYKDWLQIPYYDTQGRLIGVQRRYMGTEPNQPRFRFLPGAECHLYNQPVIPMLREGEPLYIGEGPSDVWALLSSGKKAVGIPSATLLKTQDLGLFRPFSALKTTLHIYPDKDKAGESLYRQLLSVANDIGICLIRHELPEDCKDFSDYWKREASPVTRSTTKTDKHTL